jgi:D-glycero-D-manno-heptose 1,7-bisphosphate phosphatase
MKAIFLDKDGTIVDNSMYPEIPKNDILVEDIINGLTHLQKKGYKLFLVSNQSWIAKGKLTPEEVETIFVGLKNKLSHYGINIEGHIYCPHRSEDLCHCRKPRPGMILELAKKHFIDLNKSYIIGDMDEDILAGKNAGIKTILTLSGKRTHHESKPDFIIKNLNEIEKIL